MSTSIDPGPSRYSFDNDDPESVGRHSHLSDILDPLTFERLGSLGDLAGRRCLEVGAGGGSVARWLAERGADVLATDLNVRHLPLDAGFRVLRHDLVREPVPDGPWDVIHARLVLLHIPEREAVLERLAAALAPGGALVIEDWATEFGNLCLAAPDRETAQLIEEYRDILVNRVLPARGNDPTWAARVHATMLAHGLTGVDTVINAASWPGGSPGAVLIAVNVAQLREDFVAAGFTPERIRQLYSAVRDPRLVVRSHFTYSTIGRRPDGS
ncbi:methyltransferase domain-containing protein [Dactylosporangium sp. NPDC000244]|uniref:class I SAM-dependent methyltransferase n=1 Tax=Dactylosporangium sp. NPDC000244 TaxID=3154365 RepID=UPI0033170DA1